MTGERRRSDTDQEAKALASSLRLRILRICLDEARTNKEIADMLGLDPGEHPAPPPDPGPHRLSRAQRRTPRCPRVPGDPLPGHPEVVEAVTPAMDRADVERVRRGSGAGTRRPDRRVPAGPAAVAGRYGRFPRPVVRSLLDDFAHHPDDPASPAWSLFVTLHPRPQPPTPAGLTAARAPPTRSPCPAARGPPTRSRSVQPLAFLYSRSHCTASEGTTTRAARARRAGAGNAGGSTASGR